MSDTIFALSSGHLPSGVAVIRLSGNDAFRASSVLVGTLPPPRQAGLRYLYGIDGKPIDQGLVLVFPGPASFTGEDCVELQIHGGRAVVAALLEELSRFPNLRHAEPGEFSRRAFENGRLDLVEVEGLADLINAETEMQRRLALEQMAGNVSAIYEAWSERLKFARAMIEAELDFADEEDVPGSVSERIWSDLTALSTEMQTHLDGSRGGEIIRDGLKVVIAGPPNAGKSTLFNALVQREAAIVTHIPGTTRDVLQADIVIGGFAVRLYDTAGIRDTDDPVEKIGLDRARQTFQQADISLVLDDGNFDFDTVAFGGRIIKVSPKADLIAATESNCDIAISSKTDQGLDELKALIIRDAESMVSHGLALASRQRQINAIHEAKDAVDEALSSTGFPLDLRAEMLRQANNSLGCITGRVDVEQLLDVIFSQFCIGK